MSVSLEAREIQAQTGLLCKLYTETWQPHSLDRLPYTREFDLMVLSFNVQMKQNKTHEEIWRELIDLRKRGSLPTRGRGKKEISDVGQE